MARYFDHSARPHNEPSGDRKAESDTSAAQNSAKNIDKTATLLQVREQGSTSATRQRVQEVHCKTSRSSDQVHKKWPRLQGDYVHLQIVTPTSARQVSAYRQDTASKQRTVQGKKARHIVSTSTDCHTNERKTILSAYRQDTANSSASCKAVNQAHCERIDRHTRSASKRAAQPSAIKNIEKWRHNMATRCYSQAPGLLTTHMIA